MTQARASTFCEAIRIASDSNLSGRSPHAVISIMGGFRVAPLDAPSLQPGEAILWTSRWGGSIPVECTALGDRDTQSWVWPSVIGGGALLLAIGAAYLMYRD